MPAPLRTSAARRRTPSVSLPHEARCEQMSCGSGPRVGVVGRTSRRPVSSETGPSYWVELRGFEPLASSLRTRRATNCATAPRVAWFPCDRETLTRSGRCRNRGHRARSVADGAADLGLSAGGLATGDSGRRARASARGPPYGLRRRPPAPDRLMVRTVRSGAFSFITYVGSVTGTGSHRPSAGFAASRLGEPARRDGSLTSIVISSSGDGAARACRRAAVVAGLGAGTALGGERGTLAGLATELDPGQHDEGDDQRAPGSPRVHHSSIPRPASAVTDSSERVRIDSTRRRRIAATRRARFGTYRAAAAGIGLRRVHRSESIARAAAEAPTQEGVRRSATRACDVVLPRQHARVRRRVHLRRAAPAHLVVALQQHRDEVGSPRGDDRHIDQPCRPHATTLRPGEGHLPVRLSVCRKKTRVTGVNSTQCDQRSRATRPGPTSSTLRAKMRWSRHSPSMCRKRGRSPS